MQVARWASFVAAAYGTCVSAQLDTWTNTTAPTAQYMTRPQAYAPVLDVTLQGNFSSGYIFLGPYQSLGAGPYIYDKYGNLVWDGFGVVGPTNAHNTHVCSYQNQPHLCMTLANQQNGYAVGMAVIINSNYQVVASVQTGNGLMPADQHEFQLINGGESALLTSYQTIPYDLSGTPYEINDVQGWLLQGVFQEVDVATGEVLFEWYSSNHVPVSESMIAPHTTDISGDGQTPHTAFDYFHINSIDKSMLTSNYLISSRHTSTIFYINSTDESIIWRLSCFKQSTFTCQHFNFSMQHDARLLKENGTHTVISLFDNASNGANTTSSESSGMVISIDHQTNTSRLISQTFAPVKGGVISDSQGNTQILPNGNIFHGWGSVAAISEHRPVGNNKYEPVLYANYTPISGVTVMSYRAFSFDWSSTPTTTKPAVYSYAKDDTTANTIYVSWNGATTVASWTFYAADKIGDTFVKIGTTSKAGFETVWTANAFHPWVMVEAVAVDGTRLRNSSFQPAFVPSSTLVAACDALGCPVSEQVYTAS